MSLIQLSRFRLLSPETGNSIKDFDLSISKGDICSIQTDSQNSAHLLLRAIATLVSPVKGEYHFMGKKVDFSNYRNLLPFKNKIGYIAPDAAMISNLTIKDNLLLRHYYYENVLSLNLDESTERLLRLFNINDKVDKRPAELSPRDLRLAITIRELVKFPRILLLECPEDFIGYAGFKQFVDILKEMFLIDLAVVFLSYNMKFSNLIANRNISIKKGILTVV